MQDFEKLERIGKDIKTLLFIGNEILRLKRALQECVRTENYAKAVDIRNDILKHQSKRESYEILYETSRFEDSILLGEPSNQFKNSLIAMDLEEQARKEAILR